MPLPPGPERMGTLLPVRQGTPPPLAEDETFSMDGPGGSFSVNVPRLYCETIGAPVQGPVMQYCLDRTNWRRGQLIELAHQIQETVGGEIEGLPLAAIESRCRQKARAMLEGDDLTLWTPMDAERVSADGS